MKKTLLLLLLSMTALAQSKPDSAKLAWFTDAKLGIFIHWGIYSVQGVDESWSFFNGYLSHDEYMKQLNGFTARNYHPEDWTKLIKESGARYAVLTTKHHDGVALWDTKLSDLSVVKKTPAQRDLVRPLVENLRKNNLKVGLYFSLLDWSNEHYDVITKVQKRYQKDSARFEKFVRFYQGQLQELQSNYRPDLWWFDGDWEHSAAEWKAEATRKLLLSANPKAILNSRLAGYGDYGTPEQSLPIARPADKTWELCMTINDSWGYQGTDRNYKTSQQIIEIFAECISKGGNLLLDIGPKEDGSLAEEQVKVLKDLGRWTKKHEDAIFGTVEGLPNGYFYGPTTLSKDKTLLYLFLPNKQSGQVMLKGVKNKINRIWVVGNGTKLNHTVQLKPYWSQHAGLVFIDVPPHVVDDQMTVLAVLLDKSLELD
ncbi:MAG: alpha-L-fucosidase [Spirosomataceae bacterium]